jgi:hypothetical protein
MMAGGTLAGAGESGGRTLIYLTRADGTGAWSASTHSLGCSPAARAWFQPLSRTG